MAKKKKPAVLKNRCYDAVRKLSGGGIHADRRTRRLKTRNSKLRKDLGEDN